MSDTCPKCLGPALRVSLSRRPELTVLVDPEPHPEGSVLVWEGNEGPQGKFLSGPDAFAAARTLVATGSMSVHRRHGLRCPNPYGIRDPEEFKKWESTGTPPENRGER